MRGQYMKQRNTLLICVGTRPEIIKMAPLYFGLKELGLHPLWLHTGQHTDMAVALYTLFAIAPDYALHVERQPEERENLAILGAELLSQTSDAIRSADPAIVLVHGDTSSALMSALAGFYQQRPVAHVEAGLRSHHPYNPFPEEKNRVLIAQLARWHFAPSERAQNNLLREGIPDAHIHMVGNTIVEATAMGISKLHAQGSVSPLVQQLAEQKNRRIVLVTAHRRENQEENLHLIADAVVRLVQKYPDLVVVWPVHPNPKVQKAVRAAMRAAPAPVAERTYVTEPLSYPELLWVLKRAWVVLTDSGGIQEEAVALHTPVLVLRETTERPEIIEAGGGEIIGVAPENILAHVNALYADSSKYAAMRQARNPFGEGHAAERICKVLKHALREMADGQ